MCALVTGVQTCALPISRSIDAKAIDSEPVDPRSVDLDHSRHDARIFGHHVIEPDEIAHRRAFAREGRIAAIVVIDRIVEPRRSEEHTSELQSLMRISYAVFCLKTNEPYIP